MLAQPPHETTTEIPQPKTNGRPKQWRPLSHSFLPPSAFNLPPPIPMRPLIIPFSFWLLALQLPFPASAIHTLADLGEFLSVAAALAAFTVAVYRLGVWRQEMHNTKDNVGAEIARHRAEVDRRFARIEQRVEKAEGGRRKAETAPGTGGES